MKARWFFLVSAILFAWGLAGDAIHAWIARTDMPPLVIETSVEVTDRHGALLRAFTVDDGRWRLPVALDNVDPDYLDMLISYEDKRFFNHSGVDPVALARAAAQALRHGRIVSGGSTLTMQVARLIEDGPTGRWHGKFRQIRLALALEQRLDKDEILTLYLNLAPFGGNLEGVRAATLAYFAKEPSRLTPAQAALLVALPQSPSHRRPDHNPEVAGVARANVLARAVAAGVLDPEAARAALRDPVPENRASLPALAAHLTERMHREAPGDARLSLALDARLQTALEKLAHLAAADFGARLSVAILVMDHRNGDVLASVGSAGYRADRRGGYVDMTRALRSPGSTLKPLAYALAFDQGLAHPDTLIDDLPMRFGDYAPQNFDGEFRGQVLVREALVQSLNIPAVSLTHALGPARLMAALRRAGTNPRLPGANPPGLAVVLGGVGMTLEDLTALYGAFAHEGRAVTPRYRHFAGPPALGTRVVSPVAAWQIGNILAAMPAPPNALRNRLAYKTGTSYGHRDAWAIGFDGAHVIGVWTGRADGTPVPGVFGAELAAPVLFEAFARLKPELAPLGPPPPETLIARHDALPAPLREFRPRESVFVSRDAPELAFPPDGAIIDTMGAPLVARVNAGRAPFTWLANGVPIAIGSVGREAELTLTGPGFVTLSVIDGAGRSARARIRLQ